MKFWVTCVAVVIAAMTAWFWVGDLNTRRTLAITRYDQRIALTHRLNPTLSTLSLLGPSEGHGPVRCKDNRADWLSSLRTSSDLNPDVWFNVCCPFALGDCWIEW